MNVSQTGIKVKRLVNYPYQYLILGNNLILIFFYFQYKSMFYIFFTLFYFMLVSFLIVTKNTSLSNRDKKHLALPCWHFEVFYHSLTRVLLSAQNAWKAKNITDNEFIQRTLTNKITEVKQNWKRLHTLKLCTLLGRRRTLHYNRYLEDNSPIGAKYRWNRKAQNKIRKSPKTLNMCNRVVHAQRNIQDNPFKKMEYTYFGHERLK